MALYANIRQVLTPLLPVLDAFAHRHRNQHSASHWWASFNILRRAARNLDTALLSASASAPAPAPASAPATASASAFTPGRSAQPDQVRARARWLLRHVVPSSYISFTQLAADNQHAPLGLLLLAILARINSILSRLLSSDDPSTCGPQPIPSTATSSKKMLGLDMGVAVSRHAITTGPPIPRAPPSPPKTVASSGEAVAQTTATQDTAKDTQGHGKRKKKGKKDKKGGDALSSLFDSIS